MTQKIAILAGAVALAIGGHDVDALKLQMFGGAPPHVVEAFLAQQELTPWQKRQATWNGQSLGRRLPERKLEVVHTPGKALTYEQKFPVRQNVLLETIEKFKSADGAGYMKLAKDNLQRWRTENAQPVAAAAAQDVEVFVTKGDWGDVTQQLTEKYGETFAVLNMANANTPGGGYTQGCPAQEENMFRRTDCHFSLAKGERYRADQTALVNGADGRVYLDTYRPRVSIRGAENGDQLDLGYPFLPSDEVFPFYELRAAALDLHTRDMKARYMTGGSVNDAWKEETTKRIKAQLDTLVEKGVRHVVLSAFGCGAFENPAGAVAEIYRDLLATGVSDSDGGEAYKKFFRVVAFGVFHAGYGPDNYTPFAAAFHKNHPRKLLKLGLNVKFEILAPAPAAPEIAPPAAAAGEAVAPGAAPASFQYAEKRFYTEAGLAFSGRPDLTDQQQLEQSQWYYQLVHRGEFNIQYKKNDVLDSSTGIWWRPMTPEVSAMLNEHAKKSGDAGTELVVEPYTYDLNPEGEGPRQYVGNASDRQRMRDIRKIADSDLEYSWYFADEIDAQQGHVLRWGNMTNQEVGGVGNTLYGILDNLAQWGGKTVATVRVNDAATFTYRYNCAGDESTWHQINIKTNTTRKIRRYATFATSSGSGSPRS